MPNRQSKSRRVRIVIFNNKHAFISGNACGAGGDA
nr:MAG TPA: hypothetical protein [Caudoviricetes sp.]